MATIDVMFKQFAKDGTTLRHQMSGIAATRQPDTGDHEVWVLPRVGMLRTPGVGDQIVPLADPEDRKPRSVIGVEKTDTTWVCTCLVAK